jgi:hypothetical protein
LLEGLSQQTDEDRKLADRADNVAAQISQSIDKAKVEAGKWRLRESLVRKQLEGIEQQTKQAAQEADELDKIRDALAMRLDMAKEDLAKANAYKGTSILPYKGTNGTWRRPVPIECSGTGIRIQPSGPSFTLAELRAYDALGRRSPAIVAVVRELLSINRNASPDGERIVPYLLFLVRPDGIRAYYEARDRLEAIGIAFGYELVDQSAEFDFPDLNDLREWRDALGPTELAAKDAWPGGTGGSRPTGRDAGAGGTGANENELGLGPNWDRWDRGDFSSGPRGYRGGRTPPGEVDPRLLAQLNGRATTNPEDTIPNDGRVEIFPDTAPRLPVLAPTPPTDRAGAGLGGGGNFGANEDMPTLGSPPARRLGVPARSLPTLGNGVSGPSDGLQPAPFGSAPGSSRSNSDPSIGVGESNLTIRADSNQQSNGGTFGRGMGQPRMLTGTSSGASSIAGGDQVTGSPIAAPPPSGGDAADPTSRPFGQSQHSSGSMGPDGSDSSPALFPPGSGSSRSANAGVDGTPLLSPRVADGDAIADLPPLAVPAQASETFRPQSSGGNNAFMNTRPDRGQPSNTWAGGRSEITSSASEPDQSSGGFPARSAASNSTASGASADGSSSASGKNASPTSNSSSASNSSKSSASGSAGGSAGSPSSLRFPGGSPAPEYVPPTITIEPTKRPLEITVACGPKGVTIHPGGYRFKTQTLASGDSTLLRTLRAIERTQRKAYPKWDWQPWITFLVEPRGEATYGLVHRQYALSGINWPSTFRVSEGNTGHFFAREDW